MPRSRAVDRAERRNGGPLQVCGVVGVEGAADPVPVGGDDVTRPGIGASEVPSRLQRTDSAVGSPRPGPRRRAAAAVTSSRPVPPRRCPRRPSGCGRPAGCAAVSTGRRREPHPRIDREHVKAVVGQRFVDFVEHPGGLVGEGRAQPAGQRGFRRRLPVAGRRSSSCAPPRPRVGHRLRWRPRSPRGRARRRRNRPHGRRSRGGRPRGAGPRRPVDRSSRVRWGKAKRANNSQPGGRDTHGSSSSPLPIRRSPPSRPRRPRIGLPPRTPCG